MRYRLIIFDFDGTLCNSFPWFSETLNVVAREFGFKQVAASEVETLRRYGPREVMNHLGIAAWKAPLIAWRLRRQMARDLDRISLFEGAGDVLIRLSARGVKLAVVTSNSRANVVRLLGPEVARRIAHFECGTRTFGKSARLSRVLKRSRVQEGDALYIGDEIRDAEAARSAGIAFGAVTWGYNDITAIQELQPSVVFAHVNDIADIAP